MARLEDIRPGVSVGGIAPEGSAKIVKVDWYGDQAIKVLYEGGLGVVRDRVLYRDEEPSLTTHARAERFSEGHLIEMFQTGHVTAILRRLRVLQEERR
jgi:hypothetical protein